MHLGDNSNKGSIMDKTFTYKKEGTETRTELLARIVQINDKDNKLSYKLYKQLRLKDKITDAEAYSYYRQLDEYVSAQHA